MKGISITLIIIGLFFASTNSAQAQGVTDYALTTMDVEFKKMNLHGLTFRIQVGAYSKAPADDLEKFFNVGAIEAYDNGDGLIRYVSPYNFGDIKTAELQKNEMVVRGIKDAFIVPFYEGGRIPYAEAVERLTSGKN